jgi:RNA polymerase sigma factor (sigma-70 family)
MTSRQRSAVFFAASEARDLYSSSEMPSAEPPDPSAEPLRRWQAEGDPEALNQLLQTEVTLLKQMIRGKGTSALSGSAATSDIAQEAVLRLLNVKTNPHFDNPRALRGYLWKSAWHLLVQRFEKTRTKPLDLDWEELPGLRRFVAAAEGLRALEETERARAVALAMNFLSLEDRELLRLVYFAERDIATAADALGLTRGAANSRLVRARRELAAKLADWSDLIG